MKNPPTFLSIPMDESIMALGMLQADQLASGLDAPVLASRRVAVLAGDGLDEEQLEAVRRVLQAEGAQVDVVSNRTGVLRGLSGGQIEVDHHWLDMPSVMFDAVYIPGGQGSVDALKNDPDAVTFVQEAYEHGKSLAATGQGVGLLNEVMPIHAGEAPGPGIVTDDLAQALESLAADFIAAIIKDRHWRRTESIDALVPTNHPGRHQDGSTGLGPI
jgi:catalase